MFCAGKLWGGKWHCGNIVYSLICMVNLSNLLSTLRVLCRCDLGGKCHCDNIIKNIFFFFF